MWVLKQILSEWYFSHFLGSSSHMELITPEIKYFLALISIFPVKGHCLAEFFCICYILSYETPDARRLDF